MQQTQANSSTIFRNNDAQTSGQRGKVLQSGSPQNDSPDAKSFQGMMKNSTSQSPTGRDADKTLGVVDEGNINTYLTKQSITKTPQDHKRLNYDEDDQLCGEERKHGSSSSEENENHDSMSSSNDLDAQQELNLSDDNLEKLHRILKENVSV